ncbi:MAG TPA: LLM class flavin-dependent oxidoreductase [Candidatus Binatia bacterium]|jgi:alkanesulfonate monooxygenase SsuD/methylene tetrahydromethanopterin reductase-like flavin-dependent oxidoreductase (luciferase family)
MNFGILQIFQNHQSADPDPVMWQQETAMALEAERLGFHSVWVVEHHFRDYAACPDNLQYLAWLAAKTSRIGLATGAVILPWNDPIRVAEKLSVLDHLSGGRAIFGMGRGLARREYQGFDIDMDTSRDRFDEAARSVLDALDTGVFQSKGPWYTREPTEIRPRPRAGFRDRVWCIAMSPDSVEAAARLGTGMAMFSQAAWDSARESIGHYRTMMREQHPGITIPPVVTADMIVCDDDASRAREMARKYIAGYLVTVFDHYELMSDHLKNAKGYDMYGNAVDVLRAIGLEHVVETYVDVQAWGTPEMIIDKLRSRGEKIGDFFFNACFRFAGIPNDYAQRSMRLFSEKVMPALA